MKYIGCHLGITKKLHEIIIRAYNLKINAFSMFMSNPIKWYVPRLDKKQIIYFKYFLKKYSFSSLQVLPHSSYLINLGHPNKICIEKSRNKFIKEINICNALGLSMLNFHAGSHLKIISEHDCLFRIIESINIALSCTKNIVLVIENAAGQGSNMCYTFEQISTIINNINDKSRIGVCIDTCHAFAAGYDIRNESECEKMFSSFDKIIGLKYLKAMHLNDSCKNYNSRVDRHTSIGCGQIGLNAFIWIIRNPIFDNIPLILEMNDISVMLDNIRLLHRYT